MVILNNIHSLLGKPPVKTPVLDSFSKMMPPNFGCIFKIRDGPSYPNDRMTGPGRKSKNVNCLFKKFFTFGIQMAKCSQVAAVYPGITGYGQFFKSCFLYLSCAIDPFSYLGRNLSFCSGGKILIFNSWHFNLNINSVQEWP